MAAETATKVQIATDAIKVPRVVLGSNGKGQEVYLYYDADMERVVISGAVGLAYLEKSGSVDKVYYLDVVAPNS